MNAQEVPLKTAQEEFDEMTSIIRQSIVDGELLMSFDIETTGLSPTRDKMIGFSFANSKGSWYADFYPSMGISVTSARAFLSEILSNPQVTLIGANIKFDLSFSKMMGIDVQCKYIELQALMHIIDERAPKGLKEMAKTYLGVATEKFKDVREYLGGFLHHIFREYGRKDADMTYKLYFILYPMVEKMGKLELFEIINFQVKVAMEMQLNGFKIDQDILKQLEKEYEDKLIMYRDAIYKQAGYEFNIDSNEQLFIFLKKSGINLEEYGAEQTKKKLKQSAFMDYADGGKLKLIPGDEEEFVPMFSTGAEVLKQIHDDVAKNILEYKKASKVISAFINSFKVLTAKDLAKKRPIGCDTDGYLRSVFDPVRTKTGRWASKEPNQQQVPPAIRKCFIATPGYKLIVADYSQLELRLITHHTGDELLVSAYNEGRDVHQQTADKLGIDRQKAKICNFSIAYLTGPFKLSKFLNVSMDEAKAIIRDFLTTYKGVKNFHNRAEAYVKGAYPKYAKTMRLIESYKSQLKDEDLDAIQKETIRSKIEELVITAKNVEPRVEMLFGRTRRLGYLGEKKILPTIINSKIQGTAGDVVNCALMKFWKMREENEILSPVRILAQVHDEIVLETIDDETHIFETVKALRHAMETSVELKVKLEADVGTGYSWLDAKSKSGKYVKDLECRQH